VIERDYQYFLTCWFPASEGFAPDPTGLSAPGPCCYHNYLFISLFYLFKISDRRTRGPLILSEEHRNT